MNCPQCSTSLPDESAFCNKCGAPTAAVSAAAPSPAQPSSQPAPALSERSESKGALPPDEPETELWKGGFSGKALSHLIILSVVWGGFLLFVWLKWLRPVKNAMAHTFFDWTCGILFILPFAYVLWLYLHNKLTVRYRLTTHRFFRTKGLLRRRIDELELMRVDDVSVQQNVLQRIFNVGTVTLITSDATDPRLDILGIDKPIEVKEAIRSSVYKRRRRVLNLGQV